jgi:S1-C subfamily serine protease
VLNIDGDVIGIMDATPDRPAGMGQAIPVDRILRSLTRQLLDPRLLGEVVTGFELHVRPRRPRRADRGGHAGRARPSAPACSRATGCSSWAACP